MVSCRDHTILRDNIILISSFDISSTLCMILIVIYREKGNTKEFFLFE